MATKNAINLQFPVIDLTVSDGGTGATTLADHGVLVGSGTSAITTLSVGSTGELLVGASTADPAFGTSATSDFTFTSSTASQTRVLTVSNTDNTVAATSAARLDVDVGGSNVGDPQTSYAVTGATAWSTGIDNSDSDKFKLSANASLGTTNVLTSTIAGEITSTLQPAFLALVDGNQTDVTGDGTLYTIIGDIEVFDQGSDYNTSTGTFTAPISGRYLFNCHVYISGSGSSTTGTRFVLSTSNRDYSNGINFGATSADAWTDCTAFADMDASDTVVAKIAVNGNSSKVGDLLASVTRFSGVLVC